MQQTVIKIGNSVGVVIPKGTVQEKNIKVGDKVQIDIKPLKKSSSGVNPRFMEMVDEFMEEHKDVLEALAKR